MEKQYNQHLLFLLLATLLISTSGPLGKFIHLPTPVIIWLRAALGGFFLFLYARFKKTSLRINSKKDVPSIILGAVFLAGHWLCYFHALKLSNVALGMLSMFTFPIFTTLLEPFFTKSKFNAIHLLLALMVFVGIFILVPEFNFENTHLTGILFGLLAGLCYALRNLILKRHVNTYDGTVLMMQQAIIVSILLLPAMFLNDFSNISTQYPYILILALFTTAIGHSLFIKSLKYFSVSTASIIGSVQPLFGILIAFIFLNEIPKTNTFIGGSIIVATVIIESVRSRKN